MQFDSDFRFDMDESFPMVNQDMPCTSATPSFSSASSAGGSFSSASSAYDPYTPSSRRSTPNQLNMDFERSCNSFTHPHPLEIAPSNTIDLTPPPNSMSEYMFIKTDPDQHITYGEPLPTTPLKKSGNTTLDFSNVPEVNIAHPQQSHIGSITPNSFGMYSLSPEATIGPNTFMMTPTQSLHGSDVTEAAATNWSRATESPIGFFSQRAQPQGLDGFDLDRHSISPMSRVYQQRSFSSDDMRARRMMAMSDCQQKSSDLQRMQTNKLVKKRMDRPDAFPSVPRAMCKCDYPGCKKAFRRNEHLKRHKQTFHDEGGRNRFRCEFCGKNQFNRLDNLKNHRKLHARPNSRNRGVEFMAEAVPIIEQEERCRKRRAPSRSKTTGVLVKTHL
ncbi:hypothetical protein B0I35DRAFT_407898 [Stachybotrys elegans]|uniref:C2H2-type domain-containing protein n=1 Tax=Stachybotrys elegans TaxID=80388 RepID=A0A8K0WRX4_9HYPO|nr:hypothetical protein B0I35DRAFT_407898 [Stachybotrys elegans]